MIRIASFQKTNETAVIGMILTILRNEFLIEIDDHEPLDLFTIADYYVSDGGNFWLAFDDDRVIGTIALKTLGNQQAALRRFYVAADYRGKLLSDDTLNDAALAGKQQTTVANLLLTRLLTAATKAQVHEIYLATSEIFHAAHCFYEKQGFQSISLGQLPLNFPRIEPETVFYYREIEQNTL